MPGLFTITAPVFFATPDNQFQFKKAIIDHLSGEHKTLHETAEAIRSACIFGTVKIDARVFCKNIPLSESVEDQELDSNIGEILKHLNLPRDKASYARITSLYDLLQQQDHMEDLIALIDNTHPIQPWLHYVKLPMIVTIGVLGFCYLQPQYFWATIDWITNTLPSAYHWLYHYIVQLNNLPIIGMAVQIGILLYYLNATFENGLDPSEDKVRELMFRSAAIALNFFAHLVSFWAAGTLPLFPALLFVSSSLVGIVESIYTYRLHKRQEESEQAVKNAFTESFKARDASSVQRNKHILLVRGVYALAITSMVIAVSILTPSVILTMAYMMSMWLAYLVQDYAISSIKKKSADTLQLAIHNIYHSPEYNYAALIAQDKAAFQAYVNEIIENTKESSKKDLLLSEMAVQLATEPFDLEKSKHIINSIPRILEQYSPGAMLNQGNYAGLIASMSSLITPQRLGVSSARKSKHYVPGAPTPSAGQG
ncbi:MAG: hypothetical protein NXI01_10075 [Gammaproteobacteria bacterium]|nr:hypothetical protein [Gammaproteobacteria bacterium]